ncbi:hypothetical protein [Streptococcus suis]|uniref:hypothetical protein n=1 Tax=Streptococcus suis TaxID=1307 RepID=UPI001E57E611|nr:hypothetical protein [Streptococcus suis]
MTENKLPDHLYKVFKLLPLGMDLPITAPDIEKLTGLDVRTIREHIRQLIVDYGIPVCGGRDNKLGGYYIPRMKQNDLLECYHYNVNTTRSISASTRF